MRTTVLLLALVVAFGMVVVADAAINVSWEGLGGFLMPNDTDPILNPFPGQSALVQLIFTPNNWVEAAWVGAGLLGDEVLLTERWINDNQWAPVAASTYTAPFQVGYIYARIFAGVDDTGPGQPTKADIVFEHYYYAGPLMATIDNTDPSNPDLYDMNRNSSSFGFGDPLDRQVIPEPSVMALAALGGLVLLIRRRFVR